MRIVRTFEPFVHRTLLLAQGYQAPYGFQAPFRPRFIPALDKAFGLIEGHPSDDQRAVFPNREGCFSFGSRSGGFIRPLRD